MNRPVFGSRIVQWRSLSMAIAFNGDRCLLPPGLSALPYKSDRQPDPDPYSLAALPTRAKGGTKFIAKPRPAAFPAESAMTRCANAFDQYCHRL
ncbi:MAG: hypothetical protein WCA35_29415 [Kovacikia sp.]